MTHDLVIRNGTVVDGSGGAPFVGDVAIDGDRITYVGPDAESATREIDADGRLVTPGFVDPHTHLDAQLCWDPAATPTSLHGVTTVVLGICGFGVAPCPPGGGEYLLRSLERVEEIPYSSSSLGVPFSWESWPEFLDYLGTQPLGVNVAGMVPHSALRYAVMGDRARTDAATVDDRVALARELRQSLDAGALGFATSRGPNHQDGAGDPVPSRLADDDELRALVGECRGRPWQINVETKFAGDADALLAEVERYAGWTGGAGARLTWTPFFAEPGDQVWRQVLAHNRTLNERVTVAPQVISQPVTVTLAFGEHSLARMVVGWEPAMADLFSRAPSERVARLADEDLRASWRAAPEDATRMFAPCYDQWVVSGSPSHAPLLGRTLTDIADERRTHAIDVLCDLLVDDDLRTELQIPVVNRDRDGAATLVADDLTLVGLGDSGAHVTSVTNYTYPTDILARLVHDEQRLPIEAAIERLTRRPARFLGIPGRGELRVGCAADVCVLDLDRLAVGPLQVTRDLPGGAPRLFRGARGYAAVVVNGTVSVRDDELTGERLGAIVRAG